MIRFQASLPPDQEHSIDRNGKRLGIGDTIRVTGFSKFIVDSKKFKTRTILEKCVGLLFPVMGFQKDWIELHLGEILGKHTWNDTIWIEPEFVELVTKKGKPAIAKRRKAVRRRRVLK
jgi:hypothetical protein